MVRRSPPTLSRRSGSRVGLGNPGRRWAPEQFGALLLWICGSPKREPHGAQIGRMCASKEHAARHVGRIEQIRRDEVAYRVHLCQARVPGRRLCVPLRVVRRALEKPSETVPRLVGCRCDRGTHAATPRPWERALDPELTTASPRAPRPTVPQTASQTASGPRRSARAGGHGARTRRPRRREDSGAPATSTRPPVEQRLQLWEVGGR